MFLMIFIFLIAVGGAFFLLLSLYLDYWGWFQWGLLGVFVLMGLLFLVGFIVPRLRKAKSFKG